MIEKNTISRKVFNILNYGFMICFGILCILPIWHVVMASVSNPRLLMASSGIIWKPLGEPTLKGYQLVLRNHEVWTGYLNTFIYVAWSALVGTAFTALAGFLVSRKNFLAAKPLTLFIMFTMMFSGGLIPSFMVVRSLGMVNTRWALMIPGLMNAFYIMMMKSAFEQLSPSFEESAKLDGAGVLTTLVRILLPLVKANVAVVIMFTVVMQWNSWYPASIYLVKRRDYWPLQLFIRELLVQNDASKVLSGSDAAAAADFTSNLVKYCTTVVGTLPVLLAYPFAQKYFVTGVTLGGVKG